MIPTRRLILLLVVLALPLLLAEVVPVVADIALLLNLGLLAAVIADLLISARPSQLQVRREVSDVLSLGDDNPARLIVTNRSSRPIQLTVHDDSGPLCRTDRLPQTQIAPVDRSIEYAYSIRPLRRGRSSLQAVHLRFPTRLGLWNRHHVRELPAEIRIYPNIRAVYRYQLLARQNRLAELGVRNTRMPGQGSQFERLRDYRYGDEIRNIDWKATARNQRLISREFNVERNQNIVLMVDCGRFMRNEVDGISYLDYALNAALMLSDVALGQGDNVSLLAFSDRVERFVRPVHGRPGMQQILQSTFDLQLSDRVSDFPAAFEYLTRMQRKRALVILITYAANELQLRVIGESLRLKSLSWLPLCVLLQDVGLQKLANSLPQTDVDAFQTAAAAEIITIMHDEAERIRDRGVNLIDTPPQLLTEHVINEYLRAKARNLM